MYDSKKGLYVAHCNQGPLSICGRMANRHGLIAGATGTGKTVSLQVLAETFSQAGVPCFMADMKGDLSGVAKAGKMNGCLIEGMGCPGGCIAGAGTNIPVEKAKKALAAYVKNSSRAIPPKELEEIELK